MLLHRSPVEYEKRVREHVARYATPVAPAAGSGVRSDDADVSSASKLGTAPAAASVDSPFPAKDGPSAVTQTLSRTEGGADGEVHADDDDDGMDDGASDLSDLSDL